MKFSPNSPCPCGSGNKYKKCCQAFHKGKLPKTALELMKSRYTAFKLKLPQYIIQTTHHTNDDFSTEYKIWENDILDFCDNCQFLELKIIEFIDGKTNSNVTFRAKIICQNGDNSFTENSLFIKENSKWYYKSGLILT